MSDEELDSYSKKVKAMSADIKIFDEEYRKKHNCRIICGKPYCNRLVDARNRHFKERSEMLLLDLIGIGKRQGVL